MAKFVVRNTHLTLTDSSLIKYLLQEAQKNPDLVATRAEPCKVIEISGVKGRFSFTIAQKDKVVAGIRAYDPVRIIIFDETVRDEIVSMIAKFKSKRVFVIDVE